MSDELVKHEQSPEIFSLGRRMFTSLDRSNEKHKNTLMRCISNCSTKVSAAINEEILIEHVFGHEVELTSEETGQVNTAVRCVLITPAGVTIECVSAGIHRDLSAFIYLFGPPPWNPPICCKPRQKELSGGKRWFTLELIGRQGDNAKADKSLRK